MTLLDKKTAKQLLKNVRYSQGRNQVSNRPVREIFLDEDLLIKKFQDQNGMCYWSGLPLNEEFNSIKHHPFAISVERLDNTQGYSYENTVLTRRIFNLGRMAFPEQDFHVVIEQLKQEIVENNENTRRN